MHIRSTSRFPKPAVNILDIRLGDVTEALNILTAIGNFIGVDTSGKANKDTNINDTTT